MCYCGEKLDEGKIIPVDKDNHTGKTEIRDAKEANCAEEGYTGDTYCVDCNTKLKEGTSIPVDKDNHVWDSGVVTKEATTTEEGVKHYTCTLCKETKDESIPVLVEDADQKDTTVADTQIDTRANAVILDSGLKAAPKGKNVKISWGKVAGANKYTVYAAYCGDKKYKKIKTVSSTSVTISKINGKAINQKKVYKLYVEAFNGSKSLGRSLSVHIVGNKNKGCTNPKAVIVKKTKVVLAKGKTSAIKASVTLQNSKRRLIGEGHAQTLRYLSDNKKVATVTKDGVIKGVAAGTARIYVITFNGAKKVVKVTVK